MERNAVEGKVRSLLQDILKKEDIQLDTPLLGKQGIMDSVTVVQLIRQLEKDFGVRFADDDLDLETLANMGTVVDLIVNYSNCK